MSVFAIINGWEDAIAVALLLLYIGFVSRKADTGTSADAASELRRDATVHVRPGTTPPG